MHEMIKTKRLGKGHEVRVEKATYSFSNGTETYLYVMVINHDNVQERKEYFNDVDDAIEFFKRFTKVAECKEFILSGEFPKLKLTEEQKRQTSEYVEVLIKGFLPESWDGEHEEEEFKELVKGVQEKAIVREFATDEDLIDFVRDELIREDCVLD